MDSPRNFDDGDEDRPPEDHPVDPSDSRPSSAHMQPHTPQRSCSESGAFRSAATSADFGLDEHCESSCVGDDQIVTMTEFSLEARVVTDYRSEAVIAPNGMPGRRASEFFSPPRCSSRLSLDSSAGDTGGLFGFDIGGSLAKLVLFVPQDRDNTLKPVADKLADFLHVRTGSMETSFQYDVELSFPVDGVGVFLFMSFDTKDMEKVLDIVETHDLARGLKSVFIAGGGAYRFESLLKERLGVEVFKEDELATVVHGVAFMLENSVDELYALEHSRFGEESLMRRVTRKQDEIYPFLLVNIGSGVSILEVRTCFDFDRVTGSALGGATYWGLCKLLTSFKSFDESMEAAGSGAVNRVNLSVGDIYGGDYANVGLPANVTAAFFGKATRADDPRDEIVDADIAKSLIQMIAQNVTHIAFMVAHMRSIKRVVFTGNFLRRNVIAQQTVSYSLAKWSELASSRDHSVPLMEALFLRHEGYFGAVGAFLKNRSNAAGYTNAQGSPVATEDGESLMSPPALARLSATRPGATSGDQ